MQFFVQWISNIIVFILVASLVMMLIPNSSLAKYVKFVASLLLIVMMLQPIFQIFKVNIKDVLGTYQSKTLQADGSIKNEINNKKKDIEATERAYILNQMAVQMKKSVEKSFSKEFKQQIDTVSLEVDEKKSSINSPSDVSKVIVTIGKNQSQSNDVQPVQEVSINSSEPTEMDSNKQLKNDIRQFLAIKWQLDEKQIDIQLEGGE
ncbi:stage III sporulation protein AF [Bacillus sp. RG28]|uniref:Stage III sporulation protein AF n=1 Tax=Gottfriedia endophytica TaxID=2820819 RepID=A0A940NKX2_9BACI|nr:stage III sporulation protein AF [Gottfriedia endophytica]MBP0724416.1 stage III sporulation protein AF [Gottfriedia endophytica]